MLGASFFVVIDSDDACVPEALSRFVSVWASIPEDLRGALAGILARCQTADGVSIGPSLPDERTADFAELALLGRLPHDTWTAMRTDVLRNYPFPELAVPLLPEGALWQQIARRYRWQLLDECLLIYYRADHGRADQLSRMSAWRYPPAWPSMQKTILEHSWRFARRAPATFLRAAVHFDRFSLHAGLSVFREITMLEHAHRPARCAFPSCRSRTRHISQTVGTLPASTRPRSGSTRSRCPTDVALQRSVEGGRRTRAMPQSGRCPRQNVTRGRRPSRGLRARAAESRLR